MKGVLVQVIIIIFIISASHYYHVLLLVQVIIPVRQTLTSMYTRVRLGRREEYAWCLFPPHYLNCAHYRWLFVGRMIKAKREQK